MIESPLKPHSNDNDVFTFRLLAVAAASVVRTLKAGEEKQKQTDRNARRRDADEENGKQRMDYLALHDDGLSEYEHDDSSERGKRPERKDGPVEYPETRDRYVNRRLHDFAAFERRYRK